MKTTLIKAAATLIAVMAGAFVLGAGAAQADDQTYLNYLSQNGIGTSIMNPPTTVALGHIVCDDIRTGMSPADAAQLPRGPLLDGAGMVAAAQHELCPDTLHSS
jgi:hypothetical protein